MGKCIQGVFSYLTNVRLSKRIYRYFYVEKTLRKINMGYDVIYFYRMADLEEQVNYFCNKDNENCAMPKDSRLNSEC